MSRRTKVVAAGVAAVVVLVGLVVPVVLVAAIAGGGGSAAAAQCPASSAARVITTAGQLTAAQLAIAETVIEVADVAAGATSNGPQLAVLGLMGALQESGLRNDAPGIGGGGSVGIFQQIAGDGWGTVADEEQPVEAAEMFFGIAPQLSRNRGLLQVPWQTLTPDQAVQAVQGSAFPNAYAQWQPLAEQLVANARSSGASIVVANCTSPGGLTLPGSGPGSTLPAAVVAAIEAAPGPAQTAISYALAQLGRPYQWGATGPNAFDCSGLIMAAYASAGVSIPRTSEEQYAGLPAVNQLQPGDLIFYEGRPPGHVVLYLGAGWVIEAPHTGAVVHVLPIYAGAIGAARPVFIPA